MLGSSGSREAFFTTGVTEASFSDAGKTQNLIDALKIVEMNGDNSAAYFWITQVGTGSSSLDLHAALLRMC